MPETPQAIENTDAVAAVDGIDQITIGTNDLGARFILGSGDRAVLLGALGADVRGLRELRVG